MSKYILCALLGYFAGGFSPAASILFVAPALPLPNVRMSKPRRRDSRYDGLKHPAK